MRQRIVRFIDRLAVRWLERRYKSGFPWQS